ncbi:MAG: hypothetical protein IJD35_05570 [Clostridia bacterium]|nr:hypothetical protein [Clostridia bacterium]
MSKKTNNQLPDLLETFEELKTLGDDILLPLSVESDTLTEKVGKAQKEVPVSHLHRFDFGDFFISIVYTPNRSSLTAAPSVLEARICLDRTESLFFLTPYDIIPYINQSDLICRYFPYIESAERLKSCYHDLVESLVPYLTDFTRIAADSQELTKTYDNLRGEMVRCYGNNIFLPSDKGEEFDSTMLAFRFYHFTRWRSSFFCSNEYNQFLIGNYNALTMLTARRAVPDYFRHLALSVPALNQAPVKPVRDTSASLPAMIKASKRATSFSLLLIATLVALPFLGILFGILYFGIAAILGGNTEFYTSLTLTSYLNNYTVILLVSFALSYTTANLLLRIFAKQRYLDYKPYRLMLKKNPPHRFPGKLKKIVIFLAVILIVLSASRGVMFKDTSISVPTSFLPFDNEHLEYDDIEAVYKYERKDGSFYYVFSLNGGTESFSLESVMSYYEYGYVSEKLAPIFEKHGLTVEKAPEKTPDTTTSSDTTKTTAPETAPVTTPDTGTPGKDNATVQATPTM